MGAFMIELFQMWALVEVLGVVCLPLTVVVFHNLPDRGWAFSKALAMALFAFCVWLPLMYLHFLPFSQLFIAGVALVLLIANLAGFAATRRTIAKMIRVNLPYIILTETVFLGMVFLLGWLRSFGPEIRNFEMYMDEGFIAAIMRSPHLPPNDMWFAGYSINYYYYAHFTIATLAKLLGQTPSIAFNTGICIFFGLTAANLFGVTCNVVAWARHQRGRSREEPIVSAPDIAHPSLLGAVPYGLLTMVMGLILGNLAATQQWWRNHGNVALYDWFGPTRVIDKTINEFPAFSFLLSCFHAHVLALAFTIMAIGMAFNLFLEPHGRGLNAFGSGWRLVLTLGMTALVLGGLFTMNGWDFPTYLGLAIVCIVLQQWLAADAHFSGSLALDIFTAAGALAALSFLFYVPFYLHFASPSQSIGVVPDTERSPLRDELLIYGLFAFVFFSLLLSSILKRPLFAFSSIVKMSEDGPTRRFWMYGGGALLAALVVAGIVTMILKPGLVTFVAAATMTVVAVVLLFYNIGDRSHAFVLLLGGLAFVLIAGCEIVFLKDVFAGNLPRMNTVFKFYFQAWALLSIASGAGLYFIIESFRSVDHATPDLLWLQRGISVLWGAGLVVLCLSSMAYPLAAPYARFATTDPVTQRPHLVRSNNLDGLLYLKNDPANPGDYNAIRWLNANVPGDPTIVEAIGNDYTNYARISAFTGLPTLMGWVGHEYQWRVNWLNNPANNVEFQRRAADVDLIYTNNNPAQVLSILHRYNAQYVYVGALEYAKYPTSDLQRFSAFMQTVYSANGVTIYKVK
jgi:YYY domain-containing protein